VTTSTDAGRAPLGDLSASAGGRAVADARTDRFTAVYREYAPRVLGYLRVRGVDDPEAATQEVFLAMYARIDAVEGGEAGIRALLFSMAHARLVDHFRDVARRPGVVPYEQDVDVRTSESAEDRVLGAAEERAALEMLRELPAEYGEVIALRVIVGLSLSETAGVMGRSDGAIKQLQRRALERLRERMTMRTDHE
jgi:RNA polymerase sigma factor (sigma-70 family)